MLYCLSRVCHHREILVLSRMFFFFPDPLSNKLTFLILNASSPQNKSFPFIELQFFTETS